VRLQEVLRGLQICRHLQPPLVQVVLPKCVQAPQALRNMHRGVAARHVHVKQAVDVPGGRLLLLLLPVRA
jgi:hypothetical protein